MGALYMWALYVWPLYVSTLCGSTLYVSTLCERSMCDHSMWPLYAGALFMWALYVWPLYVNTLCEHSMGALYVSTLCVTTLCSLYMWALYVWPLYVSTLCVTTLCEHSMCDQSMWTLYGSTLYVSTLCVTTLYEHTEKYENYQEKWTSVLGPDVAEHRKVRKLPGNIDFSSWAGCCSAKKRQKSPSFIVKTPVKSIGEHRKVRELPRKMNIEEVEEAKKYENLQTKPVLDPFKSTAEHRKVRELPRKMNIEEVEEPETMKIYRQNPRASARPPGKLRKFTDETNMQARNHENSDEICAQPVRHLDLATPAFYTYRKNPKCYHTVWGIIYQEKTVCQISWNFHCLKEEAFSGMRSVQADDVPLVPLAIFTKIASMHLWDFTARGWIHHPTCHWCLLGFIHHHHHPTP